MSITTSGRRLGESFRNKMQLLVSCLEQKDYLLFLTSVEDLGAYLNDRYDHHKRKLDISETEVKNDKIRWLEHFFSEAHFGDKLAIDNIYTYSLLEEAWLDESYSEPVLEGGEYKYYQGMRERKRIKPSTRKNIRVGLRAFALCVSGPCIPERDEKKILKQNTLASNAIKAYADREQKWLTRSGKLIAILMSFIVAITSTAAIIIIASAWPVALMAIVASLIFITAFSSNWLLFKRALPTLLINMFGYDYLLEGWLSYQDELTGKKHVLSRKQKLALAVSTVFAASVGLTGCVLTFGFITSLSHVTLFSFLAAGTVGGMILPPFGIACACIFFISTFALLTNAMVKLVKTPNFKTLIKKPFQQVTKIFDPAAPHNAGKSSLQIKIEKGLSFALLGFLAGVGMFGLVAMQFTSSMNLEKLLLNAFFMNPDVAMKIAYGISMTTALFGQIPFILESTSRTVALIIKPIIHYFSPTKNKLTLSKEEGSLENKSSFARISRFAAYFFSAIGAGGMAINSFKNLALSLVACTAAAWNTFIGPASSEHDDLKEVRERASTARLMQMLSVRPSLLRMGEEITPLPRQKTRWYERMYST